MIKLELDKKQEITPGFGFGALIFGIMTITFGISSIVGSAVTGTKNIQQAKQRAPEKTLTNSVFSNTYKTNMY